MAYVGKNREPKKTLDIQLDMFRPRDTAEAEELINLLAQEKGIDPETLTALDGLPESRATLIKRRVNTTRSRERLEKNIRRNGGFDWIEGHR